MLAVRASYSELVHALDKKKSTVNESESESESEGGKLSLYSAALHLTKLCLGTGVLALPFATTKGGTLFMPLGITVIALLNGFSCHMMIECKKCCETSRVPPGLSSTYSKIAFCSGGWPAVIVTDASIIMTLLGVCISYQITFSSLMEDFLKGLGGVFAVSSWALSVASFVILMAPVLITEDISSLTRFSFGGLVTLLGGVGSIFAFGVELYGLDVINGSVTPRVQPLPLFPQSLEDFFASIGVVVFGFGICSLVFPVEESLQTKSDFSTAVTLSLVFVGLTYSIVGVGGAILFVHDPAGVGSNVLRNLPSASLAAQLVRLSMAATCLLTFPLAFVPPAKMIESYLSSLLTRCGLTSTPHLAYYTEINGESSEPRLSTPVRYSNRALLLGACTYVSCRFPCFGLLVSLLGCFTVTILSFILPPFFRLKLVSLPCLETEDGHRPSLCPQVARDCLLTLLGTLLCVVASTVVVRQILASSGGGTC